jgi:hypothetical protein
MVDCHGFSDSINQQDAGRARERTAVGIIQQHTDTQQERRTRLNAEHKLATGKSREK